MVGTAATTLFGSNRLPVIWQNGVVSQLPLPAGETTRRRNRRECFGHRRRLGGWRKLSTGVIYNGGTATIITQTTSTGCFFVTAFGINDSGRIVGFGIDPNNAARNVGIVYDIGSPTAFEVGALPGLQRRPRFRREQRRPRRRLEHDESGLGPAVHLVGCGRNRPDSAGRRHKPGLGAGSELGWLGGGPGFLGVLDSVPVGRDDDLPPRGSPSRRLGLGLVHEHFVVGARHQ